LGAAIFLGAAFLAAGMGRAEEGRVCEWVGPGLRCDRRLVLASRYCLEGIGRGGRSIARVECGSLRRTKAGARRDGCGAPRKIARITLGESLANFKGNSLRVQNGVSRAFHKVRVPFLGAFLGAIFFGAAFLGAAFFAWTEGRVERVREADVSHRRTVEWRENPRSRGKDEDGSPLYAFVVEH
jgi:hypothetical protein